MRSLSLIATAAALVPAAALAGSIRSITAPAPVLAVAFEGSRVAYAAGRSAKDCNRVYVWNLSTRSVTRLGRRTNCEQTSTGNAVAAVSIAGTRVLWVHYVGGNLRDWTLWTATTRSPSPTRLRRVTREADAPAPIVIENGGAGPGGILPYAVGRTVVALGPDGTRRFSWAAPASVVALSAYGGRLAVALEGGQVVVLDAKGRVARTEVFARTADTIRLTGSALLVQTGRSLELRGDGGAQLYSLIVGVRLAGANDDRAVLVGGGKVLTFDLTSGGGGIVADGTAAALDGERVVVASDRRVAVYALPR